MHARPRWPCSESPPGPGCSGQWSDNLTSHVDHVIPERKAGRSLAAKPLCLEHG